LPVDITAYMVILALKGLCCDRDAFICLRCLYLCLFYSCFRIGYFYLFAMTENIKLFTFVSVGLCAMF
jgi:hypothetical protein